MNIYDFFKKEPFDAAINLLALTTLAKLDLITLNKSIMTDKDCNNVEECIELNTELQKAFINKLKDFDDHCVAKTAREMREETGV